MARSVHRAQNSHVIRRRSSRSENLDEIHSPSSHIRTNALKESSLNQPQKDERLGKGNEQRYRTSSSHRLVDADMMENRRLQKSPVQSHSRSITKDERMRNGNGKNASPSKQDGNDLSRSRSYNGNIDSIENQNKGAMISPRRTRKKTGIRSSNGKSDRSYMPDDSIQRDTSAEVLASLSNSNRLRWTPGSKSFVMVERTGDSSYEYVDDEAHTRDRIILLPTRRARDLSRFRPRPSTSSTLPPIHGEMDISMLDDDDEFNREPTPPVAYESDPHINSPAPIFQQMTSKTSNAAAQQSPLRKSRSPRKTLLTPAKDRFVPISSSPLARQIDEDESQLMDEEWNANDDMLLMTPLPGHKEQHSKGLESTQGTPKETPAKKSGISPSPSNLLNIQSLQVADQQTGSVRSPQTDKGNATNHSADISDRTEGNDTIGRQHRTEIQIASADPDPDPESKRFIDAGGIDGQEVIEAGPTSPSLFVDDQKGADRDIHSSNFDHQSGGDADNAIGINEAELGPSFNATSPERSDLHAHQSSSVEIFTIPEKWNKPASPEILEARKELQDENNSDYSPSLKTPHKAQLKQRISSSDSEQKSLKQDFGLLDRSLIQSIPQNSTQSQRGEPSTPKKILSAAVSMPPASVRSESGLRKSILTPSSHKYRSNSLATPLSGRSAILDRTIDIIPTPSPRRRLQADILEDRRRSQSPRKGTPSSMVLTSPYQGSERGTPSATPSRSLRNLLDSHYEKMEKGASVSNRSVRSNRSLRDLSQEPTPTKPLRAVSGRISTPHPYRLHTLNEFQEEEAMTVATPKTQESSRKLSARSLTSSSQRSSNVDKSKSFERDLSTILAEDDASSDHGIDLTFRRENNEQERSIEDHVPRYRRSIGNIFNELQQSSPGTENDKGKSNQNLSSSPIAQRTSSPLKPVSSLEVDERDSEIEGIEDDIEDGEQDDDSELHELREWSKQDDKMHLREKENNEDDPRDDWHASSRYEGHSEEEGIEEEEEDDDDEVEEEDEEHDEEELELEEDIDSEDDVRYDEMDTENPEDDGHQVFIDEEAEIDEESDQETEAASEEEEVVSMSDSSSSARERENEEEDQQSDLLPSEAPSENNGDEEQKEIDVAYQEEDMYNDEQNYDDHSADEEPGYDHQPESDLGSRESSLHLRIDVADSPYTREAEDMPAHSDSEKEDWIEELENQMPRHLSAPLLEEEERYDSESVESDSNHRVEDHPSMSEYILDPDEIIEDPDAMSEVDVIQLDDEDRRIKNQLHAMQKAERIIEAEAEEQSDEGEGSDEALEDGFDEEGSINDGSEEGLEQERSADTANEEEKSEHLPSPNRDDDFEDVYGAKGEMAQGELHNRIRAEEDKRNSLLRRHSSKTARLSIPHQQRYAKVSEWQVPPVAERSRRSDHMDQSNRSAITRPAESSLQGKRQDASSISMNESHGSMTLSNVMRHRASMLASRPTMVEVTSMDRNAAARAAEILKAHHKYVQYGTLEADLDEDSYNHTVLIDPQQERSNTTHTAQSLDSTNRTAEKRNTPRLSRRSSERHSIVDSSRSPINSATPRSAIVSNANTPLVPGAFPSSSGQYDRRRSCVDVQHEPSTESGIPDLTVFSNLDWKQLNDFVDAQVVTCANKLRDQSVISKSQALLSAATNLKKSDVAIAFLESRNVFDHAQLHQWSEKRLVRRITILLREFVMKLQKRYPHLEVNIDTVESVAETEEVTLPTTPSRRNETIDESGFARSAERVPFRMIVESTPKPPSSLRKEVTFADSSDSLDAGSQSIYPALPSALRKRKPDIIDESEAIEDDIHEKLGSISVVESSFAAAKWASQGMSMLGSIFEGFLSRGRNQGDSFNLSNQEPVLEREELNEMPMREAYQASNPVTISRTRSVPSEMIDRQRGVATTIPRQAIGDDLRTRHVNLQSALQKTFSRSAGMDDESTRLSVQTGKTWQPPAMPARLMNESTLPSNASRSLTISRTPVRKITTGSSSYVHPTALSMLSPHTHAEAKLKANEFRESRAGRRWRSPKPMRDNSINSFSHSDEINRTGLESYRKNSTFISTDNINHLPNAHQPRTVESRHIRSNRPSSSKRSRQI